MATIAVETAQIVNGARNHRKHVVNRGIFIRFGSRPEASTWQRALRSYLRRPRDTAALNFIKSSAYEARGGLSNYTKTRMQRRSQDTSQMKMGRLRLIRGLQTNKKRPGGLLLQPQGATYPTGINQRRNKSLSTRRSFCENDLSGVLRATKTGSRSRADRAGRCGDQRRRHTCWGTAPTDHALWHL